MNALTNTGRIVADELRKAERSINLAARDTAQFLLTTLEATETHRVSPAMVQRTVRATVAALSSLVDGQEQMAMRAHPSIEKAGRQLGLTETSWGETLPKPAIASSEERELLPA
ncbi:hypothetical protein H5J25_20295 (plasmid) [Sphingomonas aliaeris]|uniref:Uncharacterized protein n=1 Tax=Sphingomonas aliaeris TaxID=2759526 RepID=A0A974S6I5_9SPHN|nr:hypothetical protein [Sphingomonas aliaeris]QQV79421.1 hypothetical protein H5J25_20295 [Sphingomonas aliaeris]